MTFLEICGIIILEKKKEKIWKNKEKSIDFPKIIWYNKEKRKEVKIMTENLNGMTIGRLKEIISNIDDNVEIGIWDHLGLVTSIEIEVLVFSEETDVDINIDGIYPY